MDDHDKVLWDEVLCFISFLISGNIALHIFDSETRKVYDIDSLWAVGPEYDKESLKEDPVVEMLEKHVIYLNDLQPAK